MECRDFLSFRGQWRVYQDRVLHNADKYLSDGKIHIVAAPGSGKTTLGIELIKKINQPTLILAPSITIREQWIERIKEGFLIDGLDANEVLSNNLKEPKTITVATYQALFSAMTKKGTEKASEENEENLEEKVNDNDELLYEYTEDDYSDFELTITMKSAGLGTLCLDECHHLRSEWWKALEKFKTNFKKAKIVSLTATPPYDSTPGMWKRYIEMCGEIDEEITIPELVKAGNLCPHQDYVIFNYPTKDEIKQAKEFKKTSHKVIEDLLNSFEFEEAVRSYRGLIWGANEDDLLEDPGLLSSVLIFLQAKKLNVPDNLLNLLGVKKIPDIDE
ncbi:MAG: DEAD/DEAH box helicase family protein [Lachnospiraceae bacterium]|jgi:superfamily II DNA or RNA helicase|nr:DEAD/DEAH box helicase family protein [Lachnospiraceae bacterium]